MSRLVYRVRLHPWGCEMSWICSYMVVDVVLHLESIKDYP